VKLIRLEGENFARLTACEIDFDPETGTTFLVGRNEAGKSSVEDLAEALLAGAGASPEMPVHIGAKSAWGRAYLGESVEDIQLIVEGKWTEDGKRTLKVTDGSRAAVKSPQALLDSLFNVLTLDVGEFSRMTQAQHTALFRAVSGLDFTSIEAEIKRVEEERTKANRIVRDIEGRMAAFPLNIKSYPSARVPTAELIEEQRQGNSLNAAFWNWCTDKESRLQKVKDAREALARAQTQLEQSEAELEQWLEANAEPPAFSDERRAEIERLLASAGTVNDQVAKREQWAETKAAFDVESAKAMELDEAVKSLRARKAVMLAEADLPVEGIDFDGDVTTLNGVPTSQLSTSAKDRLAVKLGLQLNPTLKFLSIRGASLMDEHRQLEVIKLGVEHNVRTIMELAGEGGPAQLVIEGLQSEGIKHQVVHVKDGVAVSDAPHA